MVNEACGHGAGPGFACPAVSWTLPSPACTSPALETKLLLLQDAMKAPRETVMYLPAIIPDGSRPDYLVTVDVDPASANFSQV